MTLDSRRQIREFVAERVNWTSQIQKQICRAFHELFIGIIYENYNW